MDLNDLYTACFAGDNDAIKELEKIADALQGDWTILHYESSNGNAERVRFIADQFANKNYLVKTDEEGQTALHLAVDRGRVAVVEALLDAARSLLSSSADHEDPQSKAASSSANYDHLQFQPASSLVNYDDLQFKPVSAFSAFVRQGNKWNNTALHIAVAYGTLAIVELLVRADPSDRHIQNDIGETPLYLAARLGYNEEVKLICRICTAPSIAGPAGATALHAALSMFPKAENSFGGYTINIDGFMALMNVAKRSAGSKDDSFEALLEKPNAENMTVLEMAVRQNLLDVVRLILFEHPAYQPGRKTTTKSHIVSLIDIAATNRYNNVAKLLCDTYDAGHDYYYKGLTALIVAIKRRDKDFVLNLLEEDTQLVAQADSNGWIPLHHAIDNEFDSVLGVIISTDIDLSYQYLNREVMPPLLLAAKRGHTSTVIQLLQLLPSTSIMVVDDGNGENIMHVAATQSKKEMMQYILKHCSEDYLSTLLHKKDINGNTPLHVLVDVGCYVPELIKHVHKAVWKMVKNNNLWTPFDMLYNRDEIIADQVRIKEALDDSQEADQGWKFWKRSIMGISNTPESVVPESRKSKKDKEFKKAKKILIAEERTRMKEELERYRLRTNTQIVVTALITTVTFTVGFTMPGGYHQSGEPDEGLVLLSKKKAFHIFMVSDALALALSITSLFAYFISSMYEDPAEVSKLDAVSTVLNIVSVIAVMFTFIAGSYVVLSNSPGLAITVCIICSIFFPFIMYLLLKMIYNRKKVKKLKV